MSLLRPLRDWFQRDPDGDEALARAAQRGSRRAFDALARAHESRLRHFLIRQVGAQAADDVLQETWIAAWTALPGLRQRSGFKAWLYGIGLHKCRDHQRRQFRDEAAEASLRDAIPHPPPWDDQLTQRETAQTLLGCLPDTQREVLELYYYAELTLPEVATALGRNLNTVKYQFYRAHSQAALVLNDLETDSP